MCALSSREGAIAWSSPTHSWHLSTSSALALVTDLPRPCLGGAKTISYAANMLAQRLARERGFDEALLVSPDGRVLEAQTGAVFWAAEDGAVYTPPLSEGILDSITRRLLRQRLSIDERSCHTSDLLAAAEVFLASSSWEVRPVRRIEDHEFDDAPGAVTREALKVIWREIEAHTELDLDASLRASRQSGVRACRLARSTLG